MADIEMDVGRPNHERRVAPGTYRFRLNYTLEIGRYNSTCPICKSTFELDVVGCGACGACGMWETFDGGTMGSYRIRVCLLVIEFTAYGDSKRKQNARIKTRDAALVEARRLWERRDDTNCLAFQFGVIAPDDWQTLMPLADWLEENGFPIMAGGARKIAEFRKVKSTVPTLTIPELKFTKPKGAKE